MTVTQATPVASAGLGWRFVAFCIDAALSWGVAMLITRSPHTGGWSTVVFLVEYAVLIAFGGQSAGMRVVGLRVVRVSRAAPVGWWVVPRTLLVALLIPVLFTDRHGRGLHDRASDTAVVRT